MMSDPDTAMVLMMTFTNALTTCTLIMGIVVWLFCFGGLEVLEDFFDDDAPPAKEKSSRTEIASAVGKVPPAPVQRPTAAKEHDE